MSSLDTVVGGGLLVGAFGAGAGTLALVWYLLRHRGKPGANWFLATLVCQAVFCLAYGTGLLVDAPALRMSFEVTAWIALAWIGPLFLAFGLEYTGRVAVLKRPLFVALLSVPVTATVLGSLSSTRHLVMREFQVVSSYGLNGALYEFTLLGYGIAAVVLTTAGVGVLLLIETVISYGPLYRREAAAVVLSTVLPTSGLLVWLLGVGPVPELNLAAALFLPHVFLDAYAFVGTKMFESNPTTRRAAERSAIDDLPLPVFVVDPDGRVVESNDAAGALLGDAESVLGEPLADVADLELGPDGTPVGEVQTISTHANDSQRRFTTTSSALVEPGGATVGRTIVLQDVTDRIEREQQLTVLNRILRHNLRNEMTVLLGALESVQSRSSDPDVRDIAERAHASGTSLVDLGQRAREFEQFRDRAPVSQSVVLEDIVTDELASLRERFPDATIAFESDEAATVDTDPEILRIALSNLLENAVVHQDADSRVAVSVRSSPDGGATIEIADDGPGIPEAELSVLEQSAEDALQHGSGFGLWIVTWGVDAIDAEIDFDASEAGTVATLTLPVDS